MKRFPLILCVACLAGWGTGMWVCAQPAATDAQPQIAPPGETITSDASEATSQPTADPPTKAQLQEMGAWAFVLEHHPELGEVLSRLKTTDTPQYTRAITQIHAISERISRLKKTDSQRAEMDLQDWKYESQIRLLAARMSLAEKADPQIQEELKSTLKKQAANKLKLAILEHERVAKREKELAAQVQKLRTNLDKTVENRWKVLEKTIQKARQPASAKNKPKPTEKKSDKKPATPADTSTDQPTSTGDSAISNPSAK